VGNITFLGCTVVSTMTRSLGLSALIDLVGGNRKALLQQSLQLLLAHLPLALGAAKHPRDRRLWLSARARISKQRVE
jgi:hypothetical protein